MAQVSAGLLVWRAGPEGPEFLLVHPGGPFWRGKEVAAWSIPKGLVEAGEDMLAAARREFAEELGPAIAAQLAGPFSELAPCRAGAKTVHAWLVQADLDLGALDSNLFEMEWPPRSGRVQSFPEVDQAAYAPVDLALTRIHKGQRPILEAALARLQPPGSSRS